MMPGRLVGALLGGLAIAVGVAMAVIANGCHPDAAPSAAEAGAVASAPTAHPTGARIEVTDSLERSCRAICDRSRRLACENVAACMPNCLAMGSVTPCTDAVTSFYRCLVAQPVQNWECTPDGVAAIKDGFCDEAQRQVVACMDARNASVTARRRRVQPGAHIHVALTCKKTPSPGAGKFR